MIVQYKAGLRWRSRWQYSNTGYIAAGRIVELVSGQSHFAFLRDRVFTRLGMTPTEYDRGVGAGEAPGYDRNAFGPVRSIVRTGAGWSFAAGDLVMTAADLARWDISMIDRSLMSATAYAAQQRETLLANGLGSTYGLGVVVRSAGDRRPGQCRVRQCPGGNRRAIEQQVFVETRGIARARTVYAMVRSGTFDRAAFTENGKFYFTFQMIAESDPALHPWDRRTWSFKPSPDYAVASRSSASCSRSVAAVSR